MPYRLYSANTDTHARPIHTQHKGNSMTVRTFLAGALLCVLMTHAVDARPRHHRVSHGLYRIMADGAGRVVGGRPRGCPRRYCGCGASLYIFGRIIPSLNLAANWLRFPRTVPAPGMVAARRHHVFVLKRHIRGNVWIVHDSNSGRHRTRIHPRSIAGFRIVNPYASRMAMQ